jgi:phage terminase small subunit
MQEAFAANYATNGGNGRKAAADAGYGKAGAAVEASRLLRNPAIAKAILECTALHLAGHAPGAVKTVHSLMRRSKSDYVRLEAAKDILTRVGAVAPARVAVTGGVSITIDLGVGPDGGGGG